MYNLLYNNKILQTNDYETIYLELQAQLEIEGKLAEQEQEALTTDYKKYEILDKSMHDGTIPKLASCYDISLAEDI